MIRPRARILEHFVELIAQHLDMHASTTTMSAQYEIDATRDASFSARVQVVAYLYYKVGSVSLRTGAEMSTKGMMKASSRMLGSVRQ